MSKTETHRLEASTIDTAMSRLSTDMMDFCSSATYSLVHDFLSDASVPNGADDAEYAIRLGQGYLNGIISSMRAPVGKSSDKVRTQQKRKYGKAVRLANGDNGSISLDAFTHGFDDGIRTITAYDHRSKASTRDITLSCVTSALLSLCGNELFLVDTSDTSDANEVILDTIALATRVTDEQYGTRRRDGMVGVGAGTGNMMGVSTNDLHRALSDVMPLVADYVRRRCLPLTAICKPDRADVALWGMLYCVGAVSMRLTRLGAIGQDVIDARGNRLGKRITRRIAELDDGEDVDGHPRSWYVSRAFSYCYAEDTLTNHATQYDESMIDGAVDALAL